MWKAERIVAPVLALLLALLLPGAAGAVSCGTVAHRGATFTVCEVDAAREEIRLFHSDAMSGEVLGSFRKVDNVLAGDGRRLALAMNGGMYHNDLSPVGLYVEDGRESAGIVTSDGPGNFGLLPNGVFCIGDGMARVIESRRFAKGGNACRHATQSGPMLVIDGKLHPRFLRDSDSLYVRNGVGTGRDGRRVVFAISDEPVNFHTFGTLFRDVLNLPQALYFDGKVSRLYAPGLGRHDGGFPMGPIVGVVAPVE